MHKGHRMAPYFCVLTSQFRIPWLKLSKAKPIGSLGEAQSPGALSKWKMA